MQVIKWNRRPSVRRLKKTGWIDLKKKKGQMKAKVPPLQPTEELFLFAQVPPGAAATPSICQQE